MRADLVRATADYPAYVLEDGWKTVVAVRVRAYLDDLKSWKRQLAAAHPDSGGSEHAFRRVKQAEARWRRSADAWFEKHQLPIPAYSEHARQLVPASAPGTKLRVLDVVFEWLSAATVPQTLAQIRQGIGRDGLTDAYISVVIGRLRARGASIATVSRGGHAERGYVLVSADRYQRPFAGSKPSAVLRLLRDGAWWPVTALADASGMPVQQLTNCILRLRRRGHVIETGRDPVSGCRYRLCL